MSDSGDYGLPQPDLTDGQRPPGFAPIWFVIGLVIALAFMCSLCGL